jgi:hypothetical protein
MNLANMVYKMKLDDVVKCNTYEVGDMLSTTWHVNRYLGSRMMFRCTYIRVSE